jgi:hypothetical protein
VLVLRLLGISVSVSLLALSILASGLILLLCSRRKLSRPISPLHVSIAFSTPFSYTAGQHGIKVDVLASVLSGSRRIHKNNVNAEIVNLYFYALKIQSSHSKKRVDFQKHFVTFFLLFILFELTTLNDYRTPRTRGGEGIFFLDTLLYLNRENMPIFSIRLSNRFENRRYNEIKIFIYEYYN